LHILETEIRESGNNLRFGAAGAGPWRNPGPARCLFFGNSPSFIISRVQLAGFLVIQRKKKFFQDSKYKKTTQKNIVF
jgi:hypothetical protein